MNGVNAEGLWTEMDNSDYQYFAPKMVYIIPCGDLCCFPAISSRLRILFEALISTVSAYSTPVCSRICGQKPLSEHPRDMGQKAVFSQSIRAPQAAIWHPGLPHCTSAGEVKQALYARIGGAKIASL